MSKTQSRAEYYNLAFTAVCFGLISSILGNVIFSFDHIVARLVHIHRD